MATLRYGSTWTKDSRTFRVWFYYSIDKEYSDTKIKVSIGKVGIQKTDGSNCQFAKSASHYVKASLGSSSKTWGGDDWKTISYDKSNPSTQTYGTSGATFYVDKSTSSKTVNLTVNGVKSAGMFEGTSTATVSITVPPIKRTITFNANGGTAVSSVKVVNGTTLDLSKYKSARTDYTLLGWNTSATATSVLPSSYKVSGNATLYAVWLKNYEAPTTSNVRAYRCGSASSGLSPSQTENGKRIYAEFVYKCDPRTTSCITNITAYINDNTGTAISMKVTQAYSYNGMTYCYAYSTSTTALDETQSATIRCSVKAKPSDVDSYVETSEDTFVSTTIVLMDFYKNKEYVSIGIGRRAEESSEESSGSANSRMDVSLITAFNNTLLHKGSKVLDASHIQLCTYARDDSSSITLSTAYKTIPTPSDYSTYGSGLFTKQSNGTIKFNKNCMAFVLGMVKINSGLSAGDTVRATIARLPNGGTASNLAVVYNQTGKNATTVVFGYMITASANDIIYLVANNTTASRGVCPADNGTRLTILAFDVL